MKYRENFSEKLRELRKAKRLTQREVAEKIDVSISMYSKYEQGLNYPSEVTLLRLINFFDISASDFVLKDSSIDIELINASLSHIMKDFKNEESDDEIEQLNELKLLDFLEEYFNFKIEYKYDSFIFNYENRKIEIFNKNMVKFIKLLEKDIIFNIEKYFYLLGFEEYNSEEEKDTDWIQLAKLLPSQNDWTNLYTHS